MKSFTRIAANAKWVAAFLLILAAVSSAPVLAESPPEIPPPTVLPPESSDDELAQLPSNASMVETLAQFESDYEQRRRMRESPASIREREDSRELYAGIKPPDAQQLLIEKFAEQLNALNAEPARFLSSAELIEPLGKAGALISLDGKRRLIEGIGPVLAVNDDGEEKKLDLTLKDIGSAYAPINPLVDLSIPESVTEGVDLPDAGIELSQRGASEGALAQPLGDMNVFYSEVGRDTDLLVSPIATGVEFFNQLRSSASPETLRFHVDLPPGARIRPDASAAEILAEDGSKLAVVAPPTAVDAQGTYVPVEMQVEDETLVLHVPHSKGDFAYPILVDPVIEEWYFQNWYQGQNLQALSNGAWKWNTSEGASSSWVYGSTYCIYSCWGSGRGLYMDTPSGNLPANRWGQWSYSAPNAETYLANAWVSPFWRDNHGNCPQSQYGQPYDYVGMWNETSWNRVLYNRANDYGWADIESWGRAFIIGMGTSSGIYIPCWRDVMGGGVRIWLEDWSQPSLTAYASNQWMDQSSIRLNVSAYDAGLGVRKFKATAQNASGKTEEWWTNHSCTGLYEAPCPHTWNLNDSSQPKLNYSPAPLPEGIRKLSVTAYDAPEKPSFTTKEIDIAIDHAPPSITLSGTVTEQATLGTERPSYTLRVDAADGVPNSSNPADARSGVTKIIIENDGKVVSTYDPGCPTQSCSAFHEVEVPSAQMPEGSHTLKIKAYDAFGHIGVKELPFTTADDQAPALDVSGMPAKLTVAGQTRYLSSFGTSGSGNGQFAYATDVAIDPTDGTLWVADDGNDRIQHFDSTGEYLGQFASCQWNGPGAVAVNSTGDVYVACSSDQEIRKFNDKGEFLKKIAGCCYGNGQVLFPLDLAFDAEGNLWIADTENSRVQKLNSAGEFVKAIPLGFLGYPWGIDIAPNGDIWVSEPLHHRVSIYNQQGELLHRVGSQGSGQGQFERPSDVEVDDNGYGWVADAVNNRVQIFDPNGKYVTQFGSKGTGDGQFNTDWWLRIAIGEDDVWVVDQGNHRVQRWRSPIPVASGYVEPISALATDDNFGVTSLAVKLTNRAGETEMLEQSTQKCEKGACSLDVDFFDIDLTEKPTGPYTLTVEAEDGAGNKTSESRDFRLDPQPPEIDLTGLLAEQDGQALGTPSGDLEITATDTNVAVSGVEAINIERDHQRVASFPSDCSDDCHEVDASYRYSALRDGAERSLQTAAVPSGATLTSLTAVSCTSASNCRAVGHYKNGSGTIVTLVEHWDGSTWKVEASPNPAGALESRLRGVDCTSASSCTAVGYYKTASEAYSPFSMRWNGSVWTIVSTPKPSGFSRVYLLDVACPKSTDCWAVGKSAYKASEEAEGKASAALFQRWDGTKWTLVGASEAPKQLSRVACASTTSCIAVSGLEGLVAARWSGSSWTQESVAKLPSGGSDGALSDISCIPQGQCAAVGSYSTEGHSAPLTQRWDGSQWSIQSTVDPVGVIPGASGGSLTAVSCPTSSACTAFGTTSSPSEVMPLMESWDGVDWALQPGPAPIEATAMNAGGAACHGAYACTVVGDYMKSGKTTALIESELPSEDGQVVTVEAVDRHGNAASESIEVDVHEEPGETPECSQETATVAPKNVVSSAEAVSAVEKPLPTAVAPSKPTIEETTEEKVDPTYSAPNPNLESMGNQADGETSVTPEGGFTLEGIACLTPAETTSAATEAKVVNGDAAVFANTAPQTDTVIRPTAGGATAVQSLRGPNAPAKFSWNLTVGEGKEAVELPSGAIAITEVDSEETEAVEPTEPEGLHSPASLNDAAIQIDAAYYRLADAQAETSDPVVAVIAQPWVVLNQGGVVPAQVELKVTETPNEYTVVYTLPPFEPNFFPETMTMEATASSIANGSCTQEQSPCGFPNLDSAARYAVYWGNEAHHFARNPFYHDYQSNDCTSFISQILRAGGMKFMRYNEHEDGSWWYYNFSNGVISPPDSGYDDTESWRQADVLPRHLWRFGLVHIDPVQQPWGWTKGNIIATDWFGTNGQGDINHMFFVVGTHQFPGGREPLLANHSTLSYSDKPWYEVKRRIELAEGSSWTRFAVALKHTEAHLNAKKHAPENLYGPGGLFNG
jgi:DNA-binding beta-propeller fold protein YncE